MYRRSGILAYAEAALERRLEEYREDDGGILGTAGRVAGLGALGAGGYVGYKAARKAVLLNDPDKFRGIVNTELAKEEALRRRIARDAAAGRSTAATQNILNKVSSKNARLASELANVDRLSGGKAVRGLDALKLGVTDAVDDGYRSATRALDRAKNYDYRQLLTGRNLGRAARLAGKAGLGGVGVLGALNYLNGGD